MSIQISRTPKFMDPQSSNLANLPTLASSNFANLPTLASSNFANQTNLESDKKPKRIKVGRSWRAFQILPRVRGILLQQKRRVGRASSGPTVPFPSFQLLGVHCRPELHANSCHLSNPHYLVIRRLPPTAFKAHSCIISTRLLSARLPVGEAPASNTGSSCEWLLALVRDTSISQFLRLLQHNPLNRCNKSLA